MTTAYVSVEQLKTTLGHDDAEAIGNEVVAQLAVDGASLINEYCGRDFALFQGARSYDAPPSERLLAADLASVTSLTWYGVALVADTDYTLSRRLGTGDYQMILRLYLPTGSTVPVTRRWDWDPATRLPAGQPWAAIEISGVWGYAATQDPTTHVWSAQIPDKIVRANEIVSTRLWELRDVLYTGGGAGGNLGRKSAMQVVIDGTVQDLLNSYVLGPLPRLAGSPYAD